MTTSVGVNVRPNPRAGAASFYLVWAGQAISKSAGPFQLIAVSLWAVVAGHGAIGVSVVTSSGLFGTLVGTLIGGVVADRLGVLKTIAICDAARFVISACIASAILFDDKNFFAFVVGCSFIGNLVTGIFGPTLRSLTPELLRPEQYEMGNSIFTAVTSVAQLVGAVLGGLAVALVGPVVAIEINSASFFVGFATSIVVIHIRGSMNVTKDCRRKPPLTAMLEGLRYVMKTPWLRTLLVVDSVVDLVTAGQLFVGLPILATAHGGGIAMGLLLSGYGAGALTGSILSGRLSWRRLRSVRGILILNVVQAPFLAAIPFLPLPFAVASLGLGGVINAMTMTYYMSLVHRSVPAELQSRVMSVLMSGGLVLQPLGTLALGVIASSGHLTLSFFWGGVIMACVGLIAARSKGANHTGYAPAEGHPIQDGRAPGPVSGLNG